jgi:cytochrome c oxidase subunit 4
MNADSLEEVSNDGAVDEHAARYARSRRRYVLACGALLALLAASAATGHLHLGIGNLLLGVGIAVLKAAIVACIFMSLREAPALTRLVAAGGLAALFVLGVLSLVDFIPRHDEPAAWQSPQWVPPALVQPHPSTTPPRP